MPAPGAHVWLFVEPCDSRVAHVPGWLLLGGVWGASAVRLGLGHFPVSPSSVSQPLGGAHLSPTFILLDFFLLYH